MRHLDCFEIKSYRRWFKANGTAIYNQNRPAGLGRLLPSNPFHVASDTLVLLKNSNVILPFDQLFRAYWPRNWNGTRDLSSTAFTKKKLYPEAIPRNSIKHANRMKEWNSFENVYGRVFWAVSIDNRSTRILLTQQFTMFNKNVSMESLLCIIQ